MLGSNVSKVFMHPPHRTLVFFSNGTMDSNRKGDPFLSCDALSFISTTHQGGFHS